MKKLPLILIFLLTAGSPVIAQLFTYGVQFGSGYTHYSLSEKNSTIQVTKGSLGFHSGFFLRHDFDQFFIGVDMNYTSTIGGTIDDNSTIFNVRSGSVNLPGLIGKKFYPGIRLFVGGVPTVYIKRNDKEFESYLEKSSFTQPLSNGQMTRNEFVFFILAGAGFEFSKFFLEIRYEHPLDFFLMEDYSTGGVLSNIDNYHYVSHIVLTLGYRFN